jgi:hypothetical protein
MLTRAECGCEQREGERGWRAYQTQEADGTDAPGAIGVGVFCPECAEREFGPERPEAEQRPARAAPRARV